ncbi:MAG: copper-binding protein [Proteobacteria bacterium]|nr:copper-binding protein [Pseudomonadota bacterium]
MRRLARRTAPGASASSRNWSASSGDRDCAPWSQSAWRTAVKRRSDEGHRSRRRKSFDGTSFRRRFGVNLHLVVAALAAALAAAPAAPALAHAGHDQAEAAPQSAEGQGVVRAVNAQQGTITIQHEAIAALRWPAMTMTFPVQSASLLNGIAEGAHVRFVLVNHEGHRMVSGIQAL